MSSLEALLYSSEHTNQHLPDCIGARPNKQTNICLIVLELAFNARNLSLTTHKPLSSVSMLYIQIRQIILQFVLS